MLKWCLFHEEGEGLVVHRYCTNWLLLPVCRTCARSPIQAFPQLVPSSWLCLAHSLRGTNAISPSFSHQSDAENMQCPAPASALSVMLRSPWLPEVVEGHLGFWPVVRSCPFLLPYSAVLSTQPGEWGEDNSWPMSLT